jgi:MYXO-CTERM domain-containing protein
MSHRGATMRTQVALVLGALALGSTAHALNQSKHQEIAVASCTAAGMPSAFCQRVGVEVYNVDANEFNDLSAHSQIPDGASACDSANASLWRVFWLGTQIRSVTVAVGYQASHDGHTQLAQHIGRALHTIQDNCAHHGMPNPQHAWHSLKDTCNGTTESPDLVPAAFACARNETDAVFTAFIEALHDNGGDFAQLADVSSEDDTHWPAYTDVCDFLGSASNWDGADRRWDNGVVRPALTAQLVAAIGGADSSQFARVCSSDDQVLPQYSDGNLDVSGGAQSCIKIHTFCLGKADSPNAQPPPWEPAPAPTTAASMHGGCSVAAVDAHASSSPMAALLLVVGLVGLVGRARRRAR